MEHIALCVSFTEEAVDAIRTVLPKQNLNNFTIPGSAVAFPQKGDRITILALDPLEFVVIDRRFRFDQNGLSEIHVYLDALRED